MESAEMSRTTETAILIALFLLRLGIPLAVTVGVGFLLRRLDRKWENEAQLLSEQPGPADPRSTAAPDETPCWLFRNCSQEQRRACAAYRNQNLPCWLARLRVEGRLPSRCTACERYQPAVAT
jgi:hypothetical protein